MANTFLVTHMAVDGPPLVHAEESRMADEVTFPRFYFSPSIPEGRVFDDQAALDAASAEGPWYQTPTEAADAAAKATATPIPAPEEPEGEHHPRRSHR